MGNVRLFVLKTRGITRIVATAFGMNGVFLGIVQAILVQAHSSIAMPLEWPVEPAYSALKQHYYT